MIPNSRRQWSGAALDAYHIWLAGVNSVQSDRLVSRQIGVWKNGLAIAGKFWVPRPSSRIFVVGAGKAGAGMAAGVEDALGEMWLKRTSGWVNVPADCVRPLRAIHLHPARPAGVNEPTMEGVIGTQEILRQVADLKPEDLCLVLISGGGSALLPALHPGIALDEKLEMTRLLMRSGATISELNTVRRAISPVKGGGLLRACRAGCIIALIISDVIGDPLETIASGPTINLPPDPNAALSILRHYSDLRGVTIPHSITSELQKQIESSGSSTDSNSHTSDGRSINVVIGNNRTAVNAAANEARLRGYSIELEEWDQAGIAASCGRQFAKLLVDSARSEGATQRRCLISGGEPTVKLEQTDGPQKGGRNQELVLGATAELLESPTVPDSFALISGGTDGEDGPTDAAGAMVDAPLLAEIRSSSLKPDDYLKVNNSYPFFDHFHALIKTGPTDTNVMDLRVAVVAVSTSSAES